MRGLKRPIIKKGWSCSGSGQAKGCRLLNPEGDCLCDCTKEYDFDNEKGGIWNDFKTRV
jgi:hypothetical protein